MAAIVAALMRPVPLAVIVLDPFSMDLLHFLPTPGLMEMKVSHSSDDIEHCFYIILPRLFWVNTLLFDAQSLIHAHGLIGVKNPAAITDNGLRYPGSGKGCKQDFEVIPLVLRRRYFAGQHRATVVL
jgi:hypothetical protein